MAVLHSPGEVALRESWLHGRAGPCSTGTARPTARPTALRDIVSRYRRHRDWLADDLLLAELEEVSERSACRASTPDADRGPSTATEQVQFFERLGALLARCAALLPCVLVFRDLHLADRATLSAVEYLLGHVFTDPVSVRALWRRVGGFKGTVVVTMSERGRVLARP